jgi:hypothetical protein
VQNRIHELVKRWLLTVSVGACLACVPVLGACDHNNADEPDGHVKTKTTRTVDTPTERTKVTTTHEKDTTTMPR